MSPRSREEVAEMLGEWIEDLNSLEGSPLIIVEGKRDLSSLAELGIDAEATSLNLGFSIADLVGSIHEGRGPFEGKGHDIVIILTDWDKRGGRLAQSLKDACTDSGLRHDLEFRRRIALIAGRWVKDVESLPSLLRNLDGGLSLDVGDHPDGVPPGP
jgi:5S rRNA maturation endonuclease (ribonuclease M5)